MTLCQQMTISANRVTLRWLIESDIPALFEMHSHPDVMRYWSSPPMTDMAEARRLFERVQDDYRTGEALNLGIERNEDRILIGTCTLFNFHQISRRAEIGYALRRAFWGQGYMHEALGAFVRYAFETLDFNRLEADIDPRNVASAKVLERLGFQREGLLRERWIVNGEVSDTALYGLLRREWEGHDA